MRHCYFKYPILFLFTISFISCSTSGGLLKNKHAENENTFGNKKNSVEDKKLTKQSGVVLATVKTEETEKCNFCYYGGDEFSKGNEICNADKTVYRCRNARWYPTHTKCMIPYKGKNSASVPDECKICKYQSKTYSIGSRICENNKKLKKCDPKGWYPEFGNCEIVTTPKQRSQTD